MKRSIISQYDQLKGRLSGYIAMMEYRYMNLCVMAEEASLLPIKVEIENEKVNLEDVANVAKDGKYAFKVFPKYDEDLLAISKGIAMSHPEFKQERQTLNIEMDDGQKVDVEYLQITMPKVNNDRYELLKKGSDLVYNDCKVQMETAKSKANAQIAILSADEKPEDIDKVKDAIKEIDKTWTEKRDKLHEDKLKEIEDAHQKYLQEQAEATQKRQEDEKAMGDGGKSLDLGQLQG